jgi:hypothetical protein
VLLLVGLRLMLGSAASQVGGGGETVSWDVSCTSCEGLDRETLAEIVWFVGEAGSEVGVAVTTVVWVPPGAMLRTAFDGLAVAAPVAPAPIENELALQAELSLLTIVSV